MTWDYERYDMGLWKLSSLIYFLNVLLLYTIIQTDLHPEVTRIQMWWSLWQGNRESMWNNTFIEWVKTNLISKTFRWMRSCSLLNEHSDGSRGTWWFFKRLRYVSLVIVYLKEKPVHCDVIKDLRSQKEIWCKCTPRHDVWGMQRLLLHGMRINGIAYAAGVNMDNTIHLNQNWLRLSTTYTLTNTHPLALSHENRRQNHDLYSDLTFL